MKKNKRIEIDNIIKDYIFQIIKVRDAKIKEKWIPKEAEVNSSKYFPFLYINTKNKRKRENE